jgi:hypothetical protein
MERRRADRPNGGIMTPRTADLLVMCDTSDDAQRESLGELLLAGGAGVEIQWIAPSLAVVLIGPCDLALDPETVE